MTLLFLVAITLQAFGCSHAHIAKLLLFAVLATAPQQGHLVVFFVCLVGNFGGFF